MHIKVVWIQEDLFRNHDEECTPLQDIILNIPLLQTADAESKLRSS